MANGRTTIVFAGGGTGGHLFPSLAIAESLLDHDDVAVRFICSDREIDRRILEKSGHEFDVLSVRPLPTRPWHVPGFVKHYYRSKKIAINILRQSGAAAVAAMGGFVSGPVIDAAKKLRIPVMLVNLDAVPGRANRYMARKCDHLFSVYETDRLGRDVQIVPMPLRRSCLAMVESAEAKRQLGMDPDRPMLLVVGGSQGAESINLAMIELSKRISSHFSKWQVLHLAGVGGVEPVAAAYEEAGIAARVLPFCDAMGLALSAADLVVSRAGANSVAEIAAAAVPAVFLPYPYHADNHQRKNAAPLVEAGGAMIFDDAVDPAANADCLAEPMAQLMSDPARRSDMSGKLKHGEYGGGADILARELLKLCN